MNILIGRGIGTETGHSPETGIGNVIETGIGNVIGTDTVTEIGTGSGSEIEIETGKDTGIMTRKEIRIGTESGGIMSGKERERGVTIMTRGLSTQREKAAGIMTMVVGTIVGAGVGAGAGVEVGACKLALVGMNHDLVLRERRVRELLLRVILLNLKICMVI